jgi:hypothetical protein
MSVADIMMGPVKVWYAPVGETLPDVDAIGYGVAWGGNWQTIGSTTKAPLSMNYDSKEEDVEVEEALAAVRRHRVGEELSIETTLAELTSYNLELATGETAGSVAASGATVGQDYISGGGRVALTEYAWGFEGEYVDSGGTSYPVRFFMYKGTARLNGKLEFGKKGYPGIGLQVKAEADLDKAVGANLFKFQRVTEGLTT